MDRFRAGGRAWFLKTYVYLPPFGPLRGAFRNTFAAPSRARREWRALRHLARHGVQADLEPRVEERRWLGFLLEARLQTADFGGSDLERELTAGPMPAQLREALAKLVRGLHQSGLRDPDLVARNILVRRRGEGPELAKIDASSSWIGRPGPRWDRARARDLTILAADLERLGVARADLAAILAAQWAPGPMPRALHRCRRWTSG